MVTPRSNKRGKPSAFPLLSPWGWWIAKRSAHNLTLIGTLDARVVPSS